MWLLLFLGFLFDLCLVPHNHPSFLNDPNIFSDLKKKWGAKGEGGVSRVKCVEGKKGKGECTRSLCWTFYMMQKTLNIACCSGRGKKKGFWGPINPNVFIYSIYWMPIMLTHYSRHRKKNNEQSRKTSVPSLHELIFYLNPQVPQFLHCGNWAQTCKQWKGDLIWFDLKCHGKPLVGS